MRHFSIILFITVFFSISCKKNNSQDNIDRDFVKGDVLVGIDSTVQLEQLFSYVNSYSLTIDEINGFYYTTTIPKDSIPYIKSILNSKPYINTRGFSASIWPHYQTDIVHNTTTLWDMSTSNQQDYIQTKFLLRMTDMLFTTKNMLIKVSTGQEIFWRNLFKTFPWVRWTDLNWIGGIELLGR